MRKARFVKASLLGLALLIAASIVVNSQQYNQSTGRGWTSQVSLTGQTGTIGTTTIFTPAADGLYRISASVACETSVATATVLATFGYKDISNTAQTIASTTGTCTTLGVASVGGLSVTFQAKAGNAVTYATTIANAPHYALRFVLEQLE